MIIGSGITLNWGYVLREEYQTISWPKTSGQIESFETNLVNRSSFRISLSYSYVVNGQQFTGHRIGLSENSKYSGKEMLNIIGKYKVGNLVTVYYSSAKTESSILESGITKQSIISLLIGAVFVIIGLLLLLKIVKAD